MAATVTRVRRRAFAAAILVVTVLGFLLVSLASDGMSGDRRRLWLLDPWSDLSQFADPATKSFMLRGTTLSPFVDAMRLDALSSPRHQVFEDETQFRLDVDVPGVKPEDMKTELEDNGETLHIFGTRRVTAGASDQETSTIDERFHLGRGLDTSEITAHLSDGVLVVTVPKNQEALSVNVDIPIIQGAPSAQVGLEVQGKPPELVDAEGQGEAPEPMAGEDQGDASTLMDREGKGEDPSLLDWEGQGEAPALTDARALINVGELRRDGKERRKKRKLNQRH